MIRFLFISFFLFPPRNFAAAVSSVTFVTPPLCVLKNKVSSFRDVYDGLKYFGSSHPVLMTCVAMVENGDSLNTDDVASLFNFFGITAICALDAGYDFSVSKCRPDACYVGFKDVKDAFRFIVNWERRLPVCCGMDEYYWLCYVRRYNPGNPYYINLLLSKRAIVEKYAFCR